MLGALGSQPQPSYLSASLYSGNTKSGVMVERVPGGEPVRTGLNKIVDDELNVPAYPEEDVLTNLARAQCEASERPGRTFFVLLDKPDSWSGEREQTATRCRDL